MGYLDKSTVTVDAILTKKGRQLLSESRDSFAITKFAVADDEIDYGLFDPAHPLGSEYYGKVIEEMPIVEASPDEAQNLRYKLVTLDRSRVEGGINVIPTITTNVDGGLTLFAGGPVGTINIATSSPFGDVLDGPTQGYTLVLLDDSVATVTPRPAIEGVSPQPIFTTQGLSTTSKVVRGVGFTITARPVDRRVETPIIITGNQSGATLTIILTVNPPEEN